LIVDWRNMMGPDLRKQGRRAVVAATIVCAAFSPAALAAVGGVPAKCPEAARRGPAVLRPAGGVAVTHGRPAGGGPGAGRAGAAQ
jgi:hypothetical protein